MEAVHSQQPDPPRHVRVGDLEVDLIARTVRRGGKALGVKGLSFELLACLIRRHPDLASTREISQAVWGENLVAGATLTQRVKLLRDGLGSSPDIEEYIETVKSRGYRLAVPVEIVDGKSRAEARPKRLLAPALALAAVMAATGWWLLREAAPPGGEPRVRPVTLFVTPVNEPAGDVELAEGLRQEIIDRLGTVDALSIAPVRQVPRQFEEGAWVLESEWVETADGADWVATLRDAASGVILAQQQIPGAGPGQSPRQVTQSVAERVYQALPGARQAQQEHRAYSPDPQAYELYLRARYHGSQYARSDLRRGVQLLDRALERDPEFARAWELRSLIYSLAGTPSYGWMRPDDAFALARRDALRALALDPGLANANVTLGNILLWHDWNPPAAAMAYRQAIDVDPDLLPAWLSIALLETVMGRHDDSLAAIDRAIELAPLRAGVYSNAGWRRLGARQFDAAIEAARRAEQLDPTHRDAYNIEFWAQVYLGRIEAALQLPGEFLSDAARGYLLAVSGRETEARTHLQSMIDARSDTYVPPAAIATVLIGLQDYERALDWLETVVDERSRGALFFRSSAVYDPLRNHPRFVALMTRVGVWDDFEPLPGR